MAVIRGKVKWASITRLNTENTPMWCIDVVVDEATAKKFVAMGVEQKYLKEPDKDGDFKINIKRNEHRSDGSRNKQPLLCDSRKNPVDVMIGNGSECSVQYSIYDWVYKGKPGKSCDLKAVMIHKLEEFGVPDGEELEADEDGFVSDDDYSAFGGGDEEDSTPPLEDDVPF